MGESVQHPQPRPATRRGRRVWRIAGYVLLALIVLTVAAAGGGYAYLRRSLPRVAGTLAVPGLQAPVSVYRDSYGVPHIFAANRHDLYFAQGYVTAQDRLWGMELLRRSAAGRLSEIFGASQVDTDKFLRSFMLRRAGEASLQAYSQDDLQVIQSYADGVNSFIRQGVLPPEFLILGLKPEPWTAVDSLSIGKLMAYDLGGNWSAEVWRYQLIQRVGPARAAELLPEYPADAPTVIGGLEKASAALDRLLALAPVPDPNLGSNNWVLAGSRTATGKPILANDPHLSVRQPAIWYQTHLNLAAEGLNVVGVTFTGVPGVVVGHNDHIAWGVTNLGPDVQDLYVEVPNPANPREFLYNGRYEPAQVYQEDIRVKGQDKPVPFTLLVTRHGPIITGVAGAKDQRPDAALALRWTAHDPSPELAAILGFDRAKNWPEFREALRAFTVPGQNFVFAATDGTIAYRGSGRIPIRKQGNGLLPVPGWTDEYEWQGFIPFDELPELVNPAAGFIATANARPVDDRYPYFLNVAWAARYRIDRIREVLQGASGATVQDMQRLQNDHANLQARTLLPLLLPAAQAVLEQDATALEREAMQALRDWDQIDSEQAVGATIFRTWYRNLQRELFAPGMGDPLFGRMADATQITDRLVLAAAQGKPSSWLPKDGLAGVAARSLRKTVADLRQELGGRVSGWQWGQVHTVTFGHVLSAQKPLDRLFNVGPLPMGGGSDTVGAASYARLGPGFAVTSSAIFRQVVDLGDPAGNGFYVVGPGVSGHPLSRHYGDQAELWTQGGYEPQLVTPEQLQNADRLELRPAA